jgi:hypothetical protein
MRIKKRIFLILMLSTLAGTAFGQGVTFRVERLSRPKELLPVEVPGTVYERLILSDADLSPWEIEREKIEFPFGIIAQSQAPDNLIYFGYHAFFHGMYQAYADHRPFVLSPDAVWLLVSQGFARHVAANAEALRHHFVDFDERVSLVVGDNVHLGSPASDWETIFPKFTGQIDGYVGEELVGALTADFSTTTPVTRIASQITIMEAMESYFEFVHIFVGCGIPEITLTGTPDDWQKVREKARQLARYDLAWWTDELDPLLEEFVRASQGEVDRNFWQAMFKYHTLKKYGAPEIIDGWIVKFFPYDKNGRRNSLTELVGTSSLPEEIVKVDLRHIEHDPVTGRSTETPLELWAGFVGLEQNPENFALTPTVGWMIRRKDADALGMRQSFESMSETGIHIRVERIPTAILQLEKIKWLTVEFTDRIVIPDELADVKIEELRLTGTISESEIERIGKLFPDTHLTINGKYVGNNEIPAGYS